METRSKYDGSVLHAPARLIAWVGGGRGAASDRERGETDRWKEGGGGTNSHTRAYNKKNYYSRGHVDERKSNRLCMHNYHYFSSQEAIS